MKLFGKWRKEAPPPAEETAFIARGGAPADTAPNSAAGSEHEASGIGKGRKVLVVDDNLIVLKAFELKLKACGFEVFTTAEGTTAVSIARQQQPDLIVLDINFPPDVGSSGLAWDGFSIMQWMRRFQEVSKIPVIIISSNDASKFREKSIAAGATAFFQKPINYDEFLLAAHRAMTQNAKAAEPAEAS
jgi:two-component system cell cycle response regulator DivK